MKRKLLAIFMAALCTISINSIISAQEQKPATLDEATKWLQKAIIASNEMSNTKRKEAKTELKKIEFLPSDRCTLKYTVTPFRLVETEQEVFGLSKETVNIPLGRLDPLKIEDKYFEGRITSDVNGEPVADVRFDQWAVLLLTVNSEKAITITNEPFILKGRETTKQPPLPGVTPTKNTEIFELDFHSKEDAAKAASELKNLSKLCSGQAATPAK
jgi:hypothetical protein